MSITLWTIIKLLQVYNVAIPGWDKTPVHLPRASEFLCRASRPPGQLVLRASKVEPETLRISLIGNHFLLIHSLHSLQENCHF